ncbi:MAG: hypothetical protein CL528_04470 [Aequorivita sp.]|nr:hypothetical protein [Aequorivita sp.]MBP41008.1 hypothetical protein [Aequorivita sp.]HBC03077.1 hypothetical protein [Aequorivita sp.]|tara:strand:+ start:10015 stop:10380 length:366 start_codon:yes stop_codon:yes gene_type:complete
MKKIVSILILLLSISAFSQDPVFQKSYANAEEEAIKITNSYDLELSLTEKQELIFQQKVEEFLIRKSKIEDGFSGKKKLDLLYQMQQEETAEMNDILTRPQLVVYKKIKPSIQPLETVEKK